MDRKFLIIATLSLLLFSANLGGLSIYVFDEAKNSTAAREMLEGNHFVPTFNYELRTDKPPLHYFFMIISYYVFGVNEFAARFFSAFFGFALVLCMYLFARRFTNTETAFWSSLILLSSIQVIIQFHLAVPDPYLIFFFSLAMFFSYSFYVERKNCWIYSAYAAISLAVLSKGPVALILSAAVWMLFLVLKNDFKLKTILSFRPLEGLLIMVLLLVPWYLMVHIETSGEWTTGFFMKHNIGRFTSVMEGHGGSFVLIPLFVFTGLFPFSIFIIQSIRYCWANRDRDLILFASSISLVIIIFFSFSRTKLPNYPAPAFPFLALLIGSYISNSILVPKNNILWTYGFYLVLTTCIPVAIYIILEDVLNFPELKQLAFFFILIPTGALIALCLFLRKHSEHAFLSVASSWIATILIFFYIVFPPIDKRNPVVKAMNVITFGEPVYYFGKYNPSFSFYMKKKILPLRDSVTVADNTAVTVLSMKKKMTDLDSLATYYPIIHSSKEFFEPYYSVVLHGNKKKLSVTKTE